LKNALDPIALSVPMLKRCSNAPRHVEQIGERLERCSNRAIIILDSLLAFSRATQKAGLNEAGALSAAVKSVQEELAPQAARFDVSFTVDQMPDVEVRCTPGLLHVVLANLCGNAIKFLEGQEQRRVRVSACKDGQFCRIDVEDTGPGIAKEMHEKIFEPFFRVEGTAAHGTGIGLATVRRIVEARAGRIEVRSDVGRGCRFLVWLPLAASAPRPDTEPAARAPSSTDVQTPIDGGEHGQPGRGRRERFSA
jgi:two-component system OmpR family sensor kinase